MWCCLGILFLPVLLLAPILLLRLFLFSRVQLPAAVLSTTDDLDRSKVFGRLEIGSEEDGSSVGEEVSMVVSESVGSFVERDTGREEFLAEMFHDE